MEHNQGSENNNPSEIDDKKSAKNEEASSHQLKFDQSNLNSSELALLRSHFFAHPGMFLRHHQQQHNQLLSQWMSQQKLAGAPTGQDSALLLLKDGSCQWPGCEKSQFLNAATFQFHVNSEHSLCQTTAAQAKVQLQIVAQLEQSLSKEKERFQAMMAHLNKGPSVVMFEGLEKLSDGSKPDSPEPKNPSRFATFEARKMAEMSKPPIGFESSTKAFETENDILRNRDFYRLNDVRPPFTYASLIRQAVIESTDRQLTLNEIYTWFQNNFAYFRRNAATWKNAIRTNLSLHKCFVRYEDDYGSFWTVDDCEFLKRRHLSRGRPRKYDPTTGKFESLINGGSASGSSPNLAPTTVPHFIDFSRLMTTNSSNFNIISK